MVRSDGDQPSATRDDLGHLGGGAPGASRFSFTARSNTAAGVDRLGAARPSGPAPRSRRRANRGSNDPSVLRATRTRSPLGPVCSRAARARTSRAPLGFRQRRVGRLADQRVAEQRHVTTAVLHRASWHLEQTKLGRMAAQPAAAQGQPVLESSRPATRRRRERPRLHRSEPQRRRPRRHRDRLDGVTDRRRRRRRSAPASGPGRGPAP